tara:strand:+ start:2577 stop:2777 length:201 start_codon:yes stop_codon:yes gene_type:complete
MKKSQLKQIIKEEIQKSINESVNEAVRRSGTYQIVSSIDGEVYFKGSEDEVKEWLWTHATEKIEKV